MIIAALVTLGALSLGTGWLLRLDRYTDRFARWVLGLSLAGLGLAAALAWEAGPARWGEVELSVVLGMVAAVTGGGPVATAVLTLADPVPVDLDPSPGAAPTGPADPTVLRGGDWIGVLERLAVVASIAAGWPEGVAGTLVVKSFGRYPELKAGSAPERFIIGTFASVLWAGACGWLIGVLLN